MLCINLSLAILHFFNLMASINDLLHLFFFLTLRHVTLVFISHIWKVVISTLMVDLQLLACCWWHYRWTACCGWLWCGIVIANTDSWHSHATESIASIAAAAARDRWAVECTERPTVVTTVWPQTSLIKWTSWCWPAEWKRHLHTGCYATVTAGDAVVAGTPWFSCRTTSTYPVTTMFTDVW